MSARRFVHKFFCLVLFLGLGLPPQLASPRASSTLLANPSTPSPVVSTSPVANTPSFRWQRVAIGGGGMSTGVIIHPRVPDLVYGKQDVSGLYRWGEAEQRWTQLLDWMPSSFSNAKGTDGLAIDPAAGREDVLYAAFGQYTPVNTSSPAASGLWRSLDRGIAWTKIFTAPLVEGQSGFGSNVQDRQQGERLQVDPQNSRYLYVGTRTSGLYRTANALTAMPDFARIASVPTGTLGLGVNAVLIDPRGHGWEWCHLALASALC